METVIRINPRTSIQKGGLKPDYILYKPPTGTPVFIAPQAGTSVYQVTQTTVKGPDGNYIRPIVKNNRLALLQNTAFQLKVDVIDPEKLDIRDTSDLTYRWKKNGAYLYAINNQNDFKGANTLAYSEVQCTQEISGIYTLEASNSTGTAVAAELMIMVYNRLNTPNLYNNLIHNGSGENGLDGWDTENGISVSEFGKGTWEHENYASIFINPRLWTEKDANYLGDATTYLSTQPTKVFRFSSDPNWINFYDFYKRAKSGEVSTDEKSNQSNLIPNLIQNEDPYEEYACFFPSKKYIDEYNDNQGKIGLIPESQQTQTYFTKQPTQQGAPSVATMEQSIDITNLEDFVDGNTCGVNRVVGNFFAYTGLGMNGYKFIVRYKDVYRAGPGNWDLYDGVIAATIRQVTTEATKLYEDSSILAYQNGGINRAYLYTALATVNPYITSGSAQIGIHTNLNETVYSERKQLISKLLINPPANASFANEGYTPPTWSYPILKDLFNDSSLSTTFNQSTGPLANQHYWGSFRRVYAKLLLIDSTTTTNKYLQGLGVINHPPLDQFNTTLTYNTLKATLDTRFLAAETALMETIVKPLNDKLFKLNLEASPDTYTEQQTAHYNTLRALVHVILSLDRTKEIKSSYAIQVVKDLKTQEKYKEARELHNALFGEFIIAPDYSTTPTANEYWQWAIRVIEWYSYRAIWGGDLNPQFELAIPAGPDAELGTLILDWDELVNVASGSNYAKRVDLDRATTIQMVPRCHDKVRFEFHYQNAFGETLSSEKLEGPSETDLLAVKEKVFISTIVNALFNKFAKITTGTAIPVYINGYEAFNITKQTTSLVPASEQGPHNRKWLSTNLNADFFTNLDNPLRLIFDKGVAAFFGIQKKLYIPQTTRTIVIRVTFEHKSIAWGTEPDSGLYRYEESEVPAEHTNFPFKFFRSGNPRVGLSQMKLCLYDNEFKRTSVYPSYYMPQKHVWQREKEIIRSKFQKMNQDWSNPEAEATTTGFQYMQATREDLDLEMYNSPYSNTTTKPKQPPLSVTSKINDLVQKTK